MFIGLGVAALAVIIIIIISVSKRTDNSDSSNKTDTTNSENDVTAAVQNAYETALKNFDLALAKKDPTILSQSYQGAALASIQAKFGNILKQHEGMNINYSYTNMNISEIKPGADNNTADLTAEYTESAIFKGDQGCMSIQPCLLYTSPSPRD